MQDNPWDHILFHFYLSLWIYKVWKESGKNTKIWITRKQKKSFLDEIKGMFHSFWWLPFGEKIKNSGHKALKFSCSKVLLEVGICHVHNNFCKFKEVNLLKMIEPILFKNYVQISKV